MKLYTYVPGYWISVGARSSAKQSTKMTREGGDDKEQRGHSSQLIFAASINQGWIIVADNWYKYSTFRENSWNTEVFKRLVSQKSNIGLKMKGGGVRPILGIKSKNIK